LLSIVITEYPPRNEQYVGSRLLLRLPLPAPEEAIGFEARHALRERRLAHRGDLRPAAGREPRDLHAILDELPALLGTSD